MHTYRDAHSIMPDALYFYLDVPTEIVEALDCAALKSTLGEHALLGSKQAIPELAEFELAVPHNVRDDWEVSPEEAAEELIRSEAAAAVRAAALAAEEAAAALEAALAEEARLAAEAAAEPVPDVPAEEPAP